MSTKIKDARSTVQPENLQEIIDASVSAKHAVLGGQQQYSTPKEWATFFHEQLPIADERLVFDPQCAEGNLLTTRHSVCWSSKLFGFEMDNRFREKEEEEKRSDIHRVTGNCVKAWEALDDLYPGFKFHCQVANPPFGLLWKVPGQDKGVDSTLYTWQQIKAHACEGGYGFFIANHKTIERLGIDKDEWAYLYQVIPPGWWKGVEVTIGVVHWQNTAAKNRPEYQRLDYKACDMNEHADEIKKVQSFFDKQAVELPDEFAPGIGIHQAPKVFANIQDVLDEERRCRPDFNIWLDESGKLRTYLSTRATIKRKLTSEQIKSVGKLNDQHPLTLTTDRETRLILSELVACGFYTIEPKAKAAIEAALKEAALIACPIMDVTAFERVAYADEEDNLLCLKPFHMEGVKCFTKGKRYDLRTANYTFTENFTRDKVHYNSETGVTSIVKHDCSLSGQDRYIAIADDSGRTHRFLDRPDKDDAYDHPEAMLWEIFQQPKVKTVRDTNPALVQKNLETLETCELLAGFNYFPGQREYLARVACKDAALIAADVGCGKTLIALSLIQMKAPKRALIIAPQGTMRSSEADDDEGEEYQASQWVSEIRRFAPGLPVFEMFSFEDYQKIVNKNKGNLPEGVYISYYEAMFSNGAREQCPESWDDERLAKETGYAVPDTKKADERYWTKTVGEEQEGIRCIISPSLATLVGDQFDMICLDEAHYCCNLDAARTIALIRLQPKYRYAFTATPIPNIVSNLFSLMGWIAVPEWHKGERRNAAWPYSREELGRFSETFLSTERDLTQEKANKVRRGRCEKISPVISSPARLLKILKPSMAYISKDDCNPNMVKCEMIDVRVPMGEKQSALYEHFLDRGHIDAKNPLVRARKQIAYLRNICADPAGFIHGGPRVASNHNPKTVAILELVNDILSRGEQTVIVCSRIGQSTTLHRLLESAGVRVARIDSTVSPDQHASQSNRFKSKQADVLIMGIKCAVGHSFDDCANLIVGSLEYSYGSLHQARGRVFRVNSKNNIKIYCVLHKNSIEEIMYDLVAVKGDAAQICLQGKRVPRDFKPVDMSEIMANSIIGFEAVTLSERDCENKWPAMRSLFGTKRAA